MFLALPANIRQWLEWLTLTNALAYDNTELMTAIKRFEVVAPEEVTILSSLKL
jgi:hypothetical protein